MRALILCAGLGTRLRPLTFVRAKAAAPVNGQPLVRRVIAWLASQDITDLVVNLHHRPASIAAVLGDGADLGVRVRYSLENPVLGSAGGPRRALPLLTDPAGGRDGSSFLLVNGDTLTDLSIPELRAAHEGSGALVTMALIPNPRPDLYGGVLVEGSRVAGFTARGSRQESFHFIGVQAAEAAAFEALPDGQPAESVMQLYPELIRRAPGAVQAHIVNASFSDIGSPAEYLQTSLGLAAVEGDRLVSTREVRVHGTAAISRTAVWDHVRVGAGARLEECIVCDGAEIPAHSSYRQCAIAPYRGETLREGEQRDGHLVVGSWAAA